MNARLSVNSYWPSDQYQLLDFGQGRKLERFGAMVLDRPCPAAENARKSDSTFWQAADLTLSEQVSSTELAKCQQQLVDPWRVQFDQVQFQLRITPYGHVGLFPEHAAQWHWLLENANKLTSESPSILNLFAYTGGATLALASHGWRVTHVDASEPSVQWARHNAQISRLAEAPVRWLVEDARIYVARELKRGRRYDAVLLDPPSYGHGPKGKAWQIERDLSDLLEQSCQLLLPNGVLVLTGHSEMVAFSTDDLVQMREASGHRDVFAESMRVTMADVANRQLDFGWCLRVFPVL